MLDANGSLVDMLFCAQLSGNIGRSRGAGDIFTDPRKVSTLSVPLFLGNFPVNLHADVFDWHAQT